MQQWMRWVQQMCWSWFSDKNNSTAILKVIETHTCLYDFVGYCHSHNNRGFFKHGDEALYASLPLASYWWACLSEEAAARQAPQLVHVRMYVYVCIYINIWFFLASTVILMICMYVCICMYVYIIGSSLPPASHWWACLSEGAAELQAPKLVRIKHVQ